MASAATCAGNDAAQEEPLWRDGRKVCQHGRPADDCGDCRIERLMCWLQGLQLTTVLPCAASNAEVGSSVRRALDSVMGASSKYTYQHDKAFKHRAQVEAIASRCLHCLPEDCDMLVELGAGQAVLGHTVSVASGRPLTAIDRRNNADAFDHQEQVEDVSRHENIPDEEQVLTTRPPVYRVTADISDEACLPQEGRVALLAKHLCAHASDVAVDSALRLGGRLRLLCLAPCCHAKMRWSELAPASKRHLEDLGFKGSEAEFKMLVKLSSIARSGATDFSRWPFWDQLSKAAESAGVAPEAMMRQFGRLACRAVDEARVARLRDGGFSTALVEYCPPEVSPDNVLLLAAPGDGLQKAVAGLMLSIPPSVTSPASEGALLEVDPGMPASFVQRLAAYLIEQQGQDSRFAALERVEAASDSQTSKSPSLLCIAKPGSLEALLKQLSSCTLLQRSAARLLPLKHVDSGEISHICAKVLQELEPLQKVKLRVSARPRSIESELCKLIESSSSGRGLLSPTDFTHTVFVAVGTDSTSFSWSVMPRSNLDPTSWLYGKRRGGDESSSLSSSYWRFTEVAHRWPQRLLRGVSCVAIWSDCAAGSGTKSDWAMRWADEFLLPATPVMQIACSAPSRKAALKAEVVRGAGRPPPASLLLCDVFGSGGEVKDLQTLLELGLQVPHPEQPQDNAGGYAQESGGGVAVLAASGTAVIRLRCAKRASQRAVKLWLRETVQELEQKLGARRIELQHLLADKDTERTAVFSWQGQPDASSRC